MNQGDIRLDFDVVEQYVARTWPDPNGMRQRQSEIHGRIVAAPWVAVVLGASRSQVLGWRQRDIAYWDADWVATSLGVHPSAMWPDWYRLEPLERVS